MDADRRDPLAARVARLEREARRWRLAATILAAAAAIALTAGPSAYLHARQQAADPDSQADRDRHRDEATQAARDRLEVSRQALKIISEAIQRGAGITDAVDRIYNWSYRMLGDEIYLSMEPDEPRVEDPEVFLVVTPPRYSKARLAAFEGHYERMKSFEDRLRPLSKTGVYPYLDFLEIQAHRIQAELFLARERLKEGQPPRVPDTPESTNEEK